MNNSCNSVINYVGGGEIIPPLPIAKTHSDVFVHVTTILIMILITATRQ